MRTRFITVGRQEDADKLSAMGFEFLYRARADNAYVFINKNEVTDEEQEELDKIPHDETNTVTM